MRRKPYTKIGIRRVPCLKCGEPSRYQWQLCAMGPAFHGVCVACDIELNRIMLAFFNIPDAPAIWARYAASEIHLP